MQRLYTAAGEALSGTPWQDYPRPQLVREKWLCLNGPWEYACGGTTGEIRVPFCPESLLSGIETPPEPGAELVYRRRFTLPADWSGRRVLLHFGAVSRIAVVRLNGRTAAVHDESYLPFTADVTDLLRAGENELTVHAVNDLSPKHPWGKQRRKRGGMWYTPVSGIWQTVWLEPVPETYIRALTIHTGADYAEIAAEGLEDGVVTLEGRRYPLTEGRVRIRLEAPVPWSPEDPHLYRFTIEGGGDRAESYFALRTLSVETVDGIPRLCLNGKPYYFHGLLDQGWWSDGLYTPASPACFEDDIAAAKALGFNTLRKHVKLEPERFYYDCDRLGMIVFQDMVNAGKYHYIRDTVLPTIGVLRRRDRHLNRDPETRRNFQNAMEGTVRRLMNHPCVCLWTIFNEGWGQFRADENYELLRSVDDSRFVNTVSGWYFQQKSDVESQHLYFKAPRLGKRPLPQLITELGGWSLKLPAHSFNLEKTYGYRKYPDRETYIRAVRAFYLHKLLPLIPQGLCGTVWTQLSDVEDETNGVLTFDRRERKLAPEDFADISQRLREAIRQ